MNILKRSQAIDILKGLAIIGVVAIHYLSGIEQADKLFYSHFEQYVGWDQLLRFCVPLFVAMSGFTLAKKYLLAPFSWKEYLLRRVIRILPLYIFWSIVIAWIVNLTPGWSRFIAGTSWWRILIYGKADYHLYFVPMIVQLYLLFPLLLYFVKKARVWALLVVFIFELVFFYYISIHAETASGMALFWGDQEQDIFFGSWLLYFVLGIFWATVEIRKRMFFYLGVTGSCLLTFLGWYFARNNSEYLIHSGIDPLIATRFTRIPLAIYGAALITLLLLVRTYIDKLRNVLASGLARIGQESYLIYLSHTLLLRILFSWWKHEVPAQTLGLALVVVVISWGISLVWERRGY